MPIAIAVHGGAGPAHPDDDPGRAREGCLAAARRGYEILRAGGSALDAVEAAAAVLEDDPQFNAGTGACLNADGVVEMDAAIMDGEALRAGAVALVRTAKNPIRLARAVMDRGPHVLVAGEGAERLLRAWDLETVAPSELVTERALRRWRAAQKRAPQIDSGGTIGAVAIDARGHVAAATSTGGMNNKLPGRIGDSPVPGAGTWADDLGGVASATGHGEMILRVGLTRAVCERLVAGVDPTQAAAEGLRLLQRVGGEAGVIVVDRQGRIGFAFNTQRMSRAWVDERGEGSGFGPDDAA